MLTRGVLSRLDSTDLFSIASAIESRSYSNLSAFQADLALMWDNTRAFYGPRSPQAACAALLERFADAVLSEWTRPKAAKAGNGNGENNKADARERARAMLAAVGNGSPTRRGESE